MRPNPSLNRRTNSRPRYSRGKILASARPAVVPRLAQTLGLTPKTSSKAKRNAAPVHWSHAGKARRVRLGREKGSRKPWSCQFFHHCIGCATFRSFRPSPAAALRGQLHQVVQARQGNGLSGLPPLRQPRAAVCWVAAAVENNTGTQQRSALPGSKSIAASSSLTAAPEGAAQ